MDKKEAREIAEALSEDTGWRDAVPDCPCTVDDVKNDERFSESTFGLEKYHPGAATGYRSEPVEYVNKAGETMNPRQQCTYDSTAPEGKLITHGEGAGTVDASSSFLGHIEKDVNTWEALGHEEYNETWKPNNDNNCKQNPPESTPKPEAMPEETPEKAPTENLPCIDELMPDESPPDEGNSKESIFGNPDMELLNDVESFLKEDSKTNAELASFMSAGSTESSGEAQSEGQSELSANGF